MIMTLAPASKDQLWLEFSDKQRDRAFPPESEYSHPAARMRAYLNRLCIDLLLPELAAEAMGKIQLYLPHPESIWEAVNGTPIALGKTRMVIIPSQAIDLEEFRVPQEWVDIPEWAADYYLAVQVNLEAGWLRLWGFTTHQQLKTEAEYDALDRTYTVEGEDLYGDTNVLWVTQKLCPQKKAEIQPLPKLSATQAKRLLAQMGKATPYGPRLQVAFAQWGALIALDKWRKKLYDLRIGKVNNLGDWWDNIFSQGWMSMEDIGVNNELAYRNPVPSRSADLEETPSSAISAIGGRVTDLGIQLGGHCLALIVQIVPRSEGEEYIIVRVQSDSDSKTNLPPDLQLLVLDGNGEDFLETRSHPGQNCIQLEFRGQPGDRFTVKVGLGEANVTEDFLI